MFKFCKVNPQSGIGIDSNEINLIMKARSFVLLAAVFLIVAVLIIFYQIKTENKTTISQFKVYNLAVYQDNCARCHGTTGEGFDSNPSLQGNNLSPEEVRHIIRFGRADMPSFPNIQEPNLTQLAELVSQR